MTKIKLGTLVNCEDDLRTFLGYRFRVATAFRLVERSKEIIAQLETFHQVRNRLFQDLGEPTNDGTGINIKPENMERFQAEINELTSVEVEAKLPLMSPAEIESGAVTDDISPLLLIRLRDLIY